MGQVQADRYIDVDSDIVSIKKPKKIKMEKVKPMAELEFKNTSTRYATHGMHPYVAAMVPALAKKMIAITKPKKLLDPFCGGGAVCVEGILAGVDTSGLDINILSKIIASAKTTKISEKTISIEMEEILKRGKHRKNSILTNANKRDYLIEYWFQPNIIKQLTGLANEIASMRNKKLKTFFQCILSRTARDCSLTYRNEVRLHKLDKDTLERFTPDAYDIFRKRTINAIKSINELPSRSSVDIRHGSILQMPFKNSEFTTIICSPPYGDERNGVPYTQFSKNMLYWLGFEKSDIADNKKRALGHHSKDEAKPLPPTYTLKKLHDDFDNEISKKELAAFYFDYNLAIKEMIRVTTEKIVIVIGNRVLNNHVVDNAAITTELFAEYGVRLTNRMVRDLPSKRIPRFGRASTVNGGCIDREDILTYTVKK